MTFASVYVAPEEKATCIKSLLSEQRDLSLQAAGHSLSAVHLRQRLYIYQRYFTALARYKPQKVDTVKRMPDRASPSIDDKLQVSILFNSVRLCQCILWLYYPLVLDASKPIFSINCRKVAASKAYS